MGRYPVANECNLWRGFGSENDSAEKDSLEGHEGILTELRLYKLQRMTMRTRITNESLTFELRGRETSGVFGSPKSFESDILAGSKTNVDDGG